MVLRFNLIDYHTGLIIFLHPLSGNETVYFCALIPLTLLSGCSSVGDHIPGWLKPYTPDVHQGNVVTSEMVDALHEGMTKTRLSSC